jgi:hypothetical protein
MPLPSGGGSGSFSSLTNNIAQTAHAFTVGQPLYWNGSAYALAKADSPNTAEVQGIVTTVTDANNFVLTTTGKATGLSGLTPGEVYWLSEATAGLLTTTQPTAVGSVSKPVLVALTATTAQMQIFDTAPASNQTAVVEYVNVGLSANTGALALNSTLVFDQVKSGSIPYNTSTGLFTLTAGKTYKLSAVVRGLDATQNDYSWFDGTTNTSLVTNNAGGLTATVSDVATTEVIYTPSVNQTVRVAVGPGGGGGRATAAYSYANIVQIGASPVPMDLVGEYVAPVYAAANVTPSAGQTSSANAAQFMSITIPTAGTWDIDWTVVGNMWGGNTGTTANSIFSGLYDNSGTFIANSELASGYIQINSTIASNAYFTGTRKFTVTTSGATTYNVKVWNTTANTQSTASTGTLGRSYMSARKISGFLPSSGQTVDYVNVTRTTNQAVANASPVLFNTMLSGNIPYNSTTGRFTLTAGKTYRLQSNVSTDNTGLGIMTAWYDVTAGANIIGSVGRNFAANNTGTVGDNISDVVFTPSVNTDVELRNVTGSTVTILGSPTAQASGAIITQLGSSAVIAGVYPGTWATYTPVVTSTGGTNPTLPTSAVLTGAYSIQGKTMFLNIRYSAASVAGGGDGTGSYQWSIPTGYTIDTTKAAIPSVLTNTAGSGLDGGVVGSGFGRNSTGGNSAGLIVMPLSTTTIGAYFEAATRLMGASSLAMTGASNATYSFVCQIPLV